MDYYGSDQENIQDGVFETTLASKGTKASSSLPLQGSSALNAKASKRTIEQTYQKKSQLEHVLLRPDTYIGSIEKDTRLLWVYEEGKMVNREVTYVPGLYKIFDEILVNAADNKQRDSSMDCLKVDINVEANYIKVWNNGKGVPVEVHSEEGIYVPEMIFGHLLTSSNYDDTEKKTTGGRNGFGAKLANIFSTEFVIETADGERQRKYKQVFTENMAKKTAPQVTKCRANEDWTCVTFKPDLIKFHMDHLEKDVVALMSKRVLDIAGCLGKTVKVELNGSRLPIKSFQDYVGLYLKSSVSPDREEPLPRIYEKVNDQWEVCISISDGQFQQVSFVNSISTTRGGTHVQLVADQVTNFLLEKVRKKAGKASAGSIKPAQVKNHLWVFVNALIVNPAFDSQTKEWLNTRSSDFGSTCKLHEDFLKKVLKAGIVESVLTWAAFKQNKDLKKTDGSKRQRLTGIPKLDDANDAGGRNSQDCTLILTEGDSAKALAVSGLSVVGRDRYGVFPLRGKLLNVRDAPAKQILENAEISHIKQILGLQHDKEYDSLKSLRYGHLMIMTDQDHDGSHIKGLLINFLHKFWPSLLKVPSFLLEFVTPIVKATGPRGKTFSFYTMPEYESWKDSLGGNTKGWTIKYYKGLGTSTPKEAKEYFAALSKHRKDFVWSGDIDGDNIDLAFSKKKIEGRKQWLRNFEPGTYLDQSASHINYTDFVNKELILFSLADNMRSIPSMVDGFKPGQRKILFSCFKRKLKSDVKVAQLAGYVSEHSAYHHGEASLMSTIVGLAQDFVGSNNINLLMPSGQFGTRLQGGKDAASPRYIFTRLSTLTRKIFPEADDCLLDYQNEDGQPIEPTWYLPILPMVLVNGSEGIGTGWSSNVPNYNPRDIVANLKRLVVGEQMHPMTPWYRGFNGTIEMSAMKEGGQSFTNTGIIEQTGPTDLEITELPIRKWTQDYKEFIEGMMTSTEKNEAIIRDVKEYHTDSAVHFKLQLSEAAMSAALTEGLTKKFKLSSSINTSNMHLFDQSGRITKYDSPEQIIESFYGLRLVYYQKRKAAQLDALKYDLTKLDNRVRFILAVVRGEIVVSNRKKADLLAELKEKNFTSMPSGNPKKGARGPAVAGSLDAGEEEEDEEDVGKEPAGRSEGKGGYDYLLGMPLWSLTLEKVQELCRERDSKETELHLLLKTDPKEIWVMDLDNFLLALEEVDEELRKEAANENQGRGQKKGRVWKNVNDNDVYVEKKYKNEAPMKTVSAKSTTVKPISVNTKTDSVKSIVGNEKSESVNPIAAKKTAARPNKKTVSAETQQTEMNTTTTIPELIEKMEELRTEENEEMLSLSERLALRNKRKNATKAQESEQHTTQTGIPVGKGKTSGAPELYSELDSMVVDGPTDESKTNESKNDEIDSIDLKDLSFENASEKARTKGRARLQKKANGGPSVKSTNDESNSDDFEFEDSDFEFGSEKAPVKGRARLQKKASAPTVGGKAKTTAGIRQKQGKQVTKKENTFDDDVMSNNSMVSEITSKPKPQPRKFAPPSNTQDLSSDEEPINFTSAGRRLPARATRGKKTTLYLISDDDEESGLNSGSEYSQEDSD